MKLTFVSQKSETAIAFRRMVCPLKGNPIVNVDIDPRLLVAPELLETGLLMPARLTRIGFGEKSASLYEAVKMLTGLDQLADLADGCGEFAHRGRRFLKFGRDNGLNRLEAQYTEEMRKAAEKASELQWTLPATTAFGIVNEWRTPDRCWCSWKGGRHNSNVG